MPAPLISLLMAEIAKQYVTVFEFQRRGEPQGIGLSADELMRAFPHAQGNRLFEVVCYEEQVGAVVGEVCDWNRSGCALHLKLHWRCPSCEMQQWGDLLPGTPNPCLWYSACQCIDKWLISYDQLNPA